MNNSCIFEIKSDFTNQYIQALNIVRLEQPKMWEYFCQNIPEFSKVIDYRTLTVIAKNVHKDNITIIDNSKEKYSRWLKPNITDIMKTLEGIFKVTLEGITAYVCVTPLFTRNICECSFLLPTNASKKRLYNIVVHELIHFYYYSSISNLKIVLDEETNWKISELIIKPFIEKCFPQYAYSSNTYSFTEEEEQKAIVYVNLFIDNKITLLQLVRSMADEKK